MMQHLDEHTIAFYAMGAEFSSPDKDAIEAHLSECHSCRAQIEELRAIDRHVAETVDSDDIPSDSPTNALMWAPRAVKKRANAPSIRLESRSLPRRVRFAALVRRHPAVAGSAGLVMAFLAFFLFRSFGDKGHDVDQPQYIRMNATGAALEVYGKDSRIFDIAVSAVEASSEERDRLKTRATCIADIDGDGTMEVLTGAPYLEDGKPIPNVLRVYSHDGQLLSKWPLGRPADFNGTAYANFFGIGGVAALGLEGSAQKEILVGLINDRSPFCLLRLDNKGRTKGEYWHFGWLNAPVVTHVAGQEGEVVLLWGINDVGYRSNSVYPAFTILDPAKIVGRTESVKSPGFGFTASQAELYYARCGSIDTALVSGVKVAQPTFSSYLKIAPDSSFAFMQVVFLPEGFPGVIYTFDKNVSVRDVWLVDSGRLTLLSKFLTKKTPDGYREFLEDLRKKVEYWDGSRWETNPTMIKHRSPPI